jgi:hypothetical protein
MDGADQVVTGRTHIVGPSPVRMVPGGCGGARQRRRAAGIGGSGGGGAGWRAAGIGAGACCRHGDSTGQM